MTALDLGPGASIPARYLNRHGLVTGPTGTGKTVTLQRIVEQASALGIPCFAPDVKTDFAALARTCPARALDPFGGRFQVPIWSLGADLLARALELSDAQAGTLEIAFAYADDEGLPLDTLTDLRTVLGALIDHHERVRRDYGAASGMSCAVISRAILRLEREGAAPFFGATGFDVAQLLGDDGCVTILGAARLVRTPRLYGVILLWLLRELETRLPECGDRDKPRLMIVFDEAHTVFADASPSLLRSVEATVRLIRSRGVGVWFASQSPDDIPAIIKDQCATRVEHARAFGVGNARFTTLDEAGRPTAARMIRPALPEAPLGPLTESEALRFFGFQSGPCLPDVPPEVAPTAAAKTEVFRWRRLIGPAVGFALGGILVGLVQAGMMETAIGFGIGAMIAGRAHF